MKRFSCIFLIHIALMISNWNPVFTRPTEPDEAAGENHSVSVKKVQLFNGKNIVGWYTFLKGKGRDNDPNKVFTVQKRLLTLSGEEYVCIATNNEYESYKLVVEFKWGGCTSKSVLKKPEKVAYYCIPQETNGHLKREYKFN